MYLQLIYTCMVTIAEKIVEYDNKVSYINNHVQASAATKWH